MNLDDLTREELIQLVNSFEKKKKYGLVWESKENLEKFELDPFQYLPVLTEIPSHRIRNDSKMPSNYLIDGDNYHVLNILKYSHPKLFDVIYLDPPYNTGNKDFKYNDAFVLKEDSYRHSKWLNFMAKRLKVAKEILNDDGIIFISIDDNEYGPLQLLADEIFGENNRLGPLIWFYEGVNDNNAFIKKTHEYVLVYQKTTGASLARDIHDVNVQLKPSIENSVVKNGPKNPKSIVVLPKGFPCEIKSGVIKSKEVVALKAFSDFEVKNHKLTKDVRVESGWSSKNILESFISNEFKPVLDSKGQNTRFYLTASGNLSYVKERDQSYVISVLRGLGTVAGAGAELKDKGIDFDYPKPVGLIKYLLSFHSNKSATVLDFFAGSGTTGEAVLSLNSDDGGNRRFVLVTNNENQICEQITYPRLEKAINGFKGIKGNQIEGYGGNLNFLKCTFIKKSSNEDEMKIRTAENLTDTICFKESTFEEVQSNYSEFKIFQSQKKVVAIYTSFDKSYFEDMLELLNKMHHLQARIYVFTFDNQGLNPNDFEEYFKFDFIPIPQKFIEVAGKTGE